ERFLDLLRALFSPHPNRMCLRSPLRQPGIEHVDQHGEHGLTYADLSQLWLPLAQLADDAVDHVVDPRGYVLLHDRPPPLIGRISALALPAPAIAAPI